MAKILFVSAHFPSLKAKYAGHKTAYKFLQEYSENNDSVDVIITANKDEFIGGFEPFSNVNVVLTSELTPIKKLFNVLRSKHLFPLKPSTRYNKTIHQWLLQHSQNYDTIHFEFTHAAIYLRLLGPSEIKNKKIVISSHDILIQSSLRDAASIIQSFDTIKTFQFEKEIYALANEVIVQNTKDKELLSALYNIADSKIIVKTPYLCDFIYSVKTVRKNHSSEHALLFWGAMNRRENADAILHFVKHYNDFLLKNHYKLYIVGANPTPEVQKLQNNHITVTGFVDDPSEYFVKVKYGIVPLLSGAGIKVKTLEMLEAGIPVISTPIGAEGIVHDNLQICAFKHFKNYL